MGCCRRRRAVPLAVLVAMLPGCVTGHLLDAARRRERPIAITAAGLDGDRLLVRYAAEITNDTGRRVGTTESAAAIPLSALRVPAPPAADAVSHAWIAPTEVARGQPVIVARGVASTTDTCAAASLEVVPGDGRDVALVWRDEGTISPWAPVSTAALTRLRIAPWVWPLLPASVAADVVSGPLLLFLAPTVMVLGE